MEDSVLSWFLLFACSIYGIAWFVRAAFRELENRKKESE